MDKKKIKRTFDKINQNCELFFRKTQEVFGCLQLWVFNSKLRLSTSAVKCDLVYLYPEHLTDVSWRKFN
jgi:hypothetical protein